MRKIALVAMVGLIAATNAFAAQGDTLMRLRLLDVRPDSTLGTVGIEAKNAWALELDGTYMVTDHFGAEWSVATSRHKIGSNGGDLGKVSTLPITLTAQWHFVSDAAAVFHPYVGLGGNYNRFFKADLTADGQNLSVKKNSWGPTLQVGADLNVSKDWFLNFDAKKLWMKTDVSLDNNSVGLKVNPWVFGVGVGAKF